MLWLFLLRLMTRFPLVREFIVALWRHVINELLFHEEAEQVMTRWAAIGEGYSAVLEFLLRLARQIAFDDERSRKILLRYCVRWTSSASQPLSVVSSALQTVLTADMEAR